MRRIFGVTLAIALCQPAFAAAMAEKHDSPARGTRTCYVKQYQSEYLDAARAAEVARYGMSTQPDVSALYARIGKGGSVGLSVAEDTYPGTRIYFRVGGKSYSGRADRFVAVPAAALMGGQPVQYSYTGWPYGNDVDGEDALGGFAAAYADCRAFLGG